MSASVDAIREEMRKVRSRLRDDVAGIRSDARRLVDWRHYVRRFPWATLAAAGAVGFLAVPRRLHVLRPDLDTLARLAAREPLVVQPQSQSVPPRGLRHAVLAFAGSVLLRAGTAYLGQQLGRMGGLHAAQESAGSRVDP